MGKSLHTCHSCREKVAEQHTLNKCSKCITVKVISDLVHNVLKFNALKIILKIHKKTRQKFLYTKTKRPYSF